jgi:hypothetical protein
MANKLINWIIFVVVALITVSVITYVGNTQSGWVALGLSVFSLIAVIKLFQKRPQWFLFLALAAITLPGCKEWVKPNEAGVLMTNWGKNKKEDYELVSGKVNTVFALGTELFRVPLFEQRGYVDSFVVTAKDGTPFGVRPSYSYHALENRAIDIVYNNQHHGTGSDFLKAVEENVLDIKVKNAYRDIAATYSGDSLYSNKLRYERAVRDSLKSWFLAEGFDFREATTSLIPSPQMQAAIDARQTVIIETQKVELQVLQARTRVEVARLEAEANKLRAAGLTSEVLREQELNNQRIMIEYWYYKGCPVPQVVSEFAPWSILHSKQ